MPDDALLVKAKHITLATGVPVSVINRKQLINTGNGVIRADNPEMLKPFGGTIELKEGWTRSVLKSLILQKRRAKTRKVGPPAQLLAEEKFTFQKAIVKTIQDNNILPDFVLNLD